MDIHDSNQGGHGTMLYRATIRGLESIVQHNGGGIDPLLPLNQQKQEITKKRGSNRTATDDIRLRELETLSSLWLDEQDRPTVPAAAFRACIETGARKLKQGPLVREGLVVTATTFDYDEAKYGTTLEQLQQSAQFTAPVVVQRNRVLRTRAKFDVPWSVVANMDVDVDLVDAMKIEAWLGIAGSRIGLGDWRPEKSGVYGRFEVVDIVEV